MARLSPHNVDPFGPVTDPASTMGNNPDGGTDGGSGRPDGGTPPRTPHDPGSPWEGRPGRLPDRPSNPPPPPPPDR